MTSELDRGVYYAKYYGRGGEGVRWQLVVKRMSRGKEKDEQNYQEQ